MRIIFIGTVLSSRLALEKLINLQAEIVGVVTKESSPVNSDFVDLTPICKEHDIPYLFVKNINSSESIEWIKEYNPDILFCFGFSALLKTELLHIAPMGVIGFHPAHLPRNRGRHPLIWALALGLDQTGVSFFFMDEGADSGDLLSQEGIPISYEDTASSLYNKVMQSAMKQIETFLPKLQNGTYVRIKQNHKLANYWRKRNREDGRIDFRMSSRAIYNLVRALSSPYPGAHLMYDGNEVKIWKVQEIAGAGNNIEPGKILRVRDHVIDIQCGDGAVRILEHEFPSLPITDGYCQ